MVFKERKQKKKQEFLQNYKQGYYSVPRPFLFAKGQQRQTSTGQTIFDPSLHTHNLILLTLSFLQEWKQRAGAENTLLSLSTNTSFMPDIEKIPDKRKYRGKQKKEEG